MISCSEEYVLDKAETLVIYGGSWAGIDLANNLIRAGYNVEAILDQHPNRVSNSPVRVTTTTEYISTFGTEAFVCISIANVVSQNQVVRQLQKLGFRRVLYLPLYLRTSAARKMIMVWNEFFSKGSVPEFTSPIPTEDSMWKVSPDDFLISRFASGEVTVSVHQEFIRTFDYANAIKNSPHFTGEYIKQNIFSNHQFRNSSPLSVLLEYTKENSDWLYDGLEEHYSAALFDPSEFYNTAMVPAIWNERGFFNILDGQHRIAWLLLHGFTGIPLQVKYEDWLSYFNPVATQNLLDYCRSINSLPTHVKHPAFIHFPVKKRTDKEFSKLHAALNHKHKQHTKR